MLAINPTLGTIAQITIVFFVLIAITIIIYARYFFDRHKNTPDMFFHDNYDSMTNEHYAECHRPFIALKEVDCQHTGQKTDSVVWVTCTCEQVHTFCDDCGENLGIRTDC